MKKTNIKIIRILADKVYEAREKVSKSANNLHQAQWNVVTFTNLKAAHERELAEAQALLEQYEPDYQSRLNKAWADDY